MSELQNIDSFKPKDSGQKVSTDDNQMTTNFENNHNKEELVKKLEQEIVENNTYTTGFIIVQALKTIYVSFPNMVYYLAYWLQNMAMLKGAELFVNEDMVTAYGMTFMWVNAWGYALIVSLNIGFMAMSAQAIGNGKQELVNLYFQRTQAMGIVLIVILSIFMLFTKQIFRLIATEEVAELSEEFLLPYLPSLIFFVFFDSMRNLFNSYKMFNPPVLLLFVTYGCQYLWILLFVKEIETGFWGVGISRTITEIINALAIFGLIRLMGRFKEVNFCWTKAAFRGWIDQLKFTIPMGSIVYMDWIAGEIQTFFVSAEKIPEQAAGHSAFVSIYLLYVVMPLGLSVTLEPYVGQAIGSGNLKECKFVVKKGFAGSLILSISLSIVCFLIEDITVDAFTNTPGEAENFLICYRIFCYIALHFYSLALNMGAILRASGKQNQAFFLPLFYYFVLGMPLQYLFVFTFDFQIAGSWYSYTIALALNALSYIYIILKMDWKVQKEVVQKNIDTQLKSMEDQFQHEKAISQRESKGKSHKGSKDHILDIQKPLIAQQKQDEEN